MDIQWSLVLFTALTGAAGWMLATIAYAEVKGIQRGIAFNSALIALIVLIVGGVCSVTHLAHPERMLGALGHPTSGIFTEAVLVGITALFTIIYLILLKRDASEGTRKGIIVIAGIFGVLLSFMSGYSYMMPSHMSWNTLLLPCGYLGTAIPAGIALYLGYAKLKGDDELGALPKLLGIGGIVAAVLAAAYVAYAGGPDAMLLGWTLAVLVGGVVPAICGFMMEKKPESARTMAWIAFVCAIIGCTAYRIFMWVSASIIDNFFGPL